MGVDISTGRRRAVKAGGGSLTDLASLLKALSEGNVYDTNAGTPISSLVPKAIGAWCLDTTNNDWYKAKGTANTDWVLMGNFGLTAAEIDVLDGVTAGTGLASKALVLDASSNVTMPDNGMFGLSRAALAATGTTSADAAVIADQVVAVTASDGTKGVALPAAATTEGPILVINTVQTAILKVYPVDGGNDMINGLAEDAAISMAPGTAAWFIPTSATQWYCSHITSVTPGTGATNLPLVLDSNGDVTMPDGGVISFSADTVAAAGTTSADAAALADQITVVTGADGAAGVVLPAAADLEERTVINDSPTYAVKVYPVDSGDDAINELAANQPFILYPRQKVTFKAISATQWYAEKTASQPARETHFEYWDDFQQEAIQLTGVGDGLWIAFAGTDGDADLAATVAGVPEGQISMGSGDGNISEDGSVLSLILLSQGSLISLGTTVFECRVSLSQLTGVTSWFGLSDKLATTAEHPIHLVDSGTVADGGLTVANAVGFAFSSDATAATKWQYTSENAGTIGNSAAEEASANGPTADTYDVLRIEVDSDGDARYYLNGVLETTRATAVATTALLIPYIAIDAGADAQVVTDLHIDYILFQGARPSSDA